MEEKEFLQKLVNESSSLAEILRKQNKSVSGAAYKILKRKLDEYKISYHQLNYTPLEIRDKKELSDILQKDSLYKSSKLKIRLIEEGFKKDICEICGLSNIWNNKPITLQLDHIDGIHSNNELINLRIICPNCHSQTETYSGKNNNKPKNTCVDCGKEIQRKSTRCPSCAAKQNKEFYKIKVENKPSKEELFELIKSQSFVSIGRSYGVSDTAVKKWCKNYGIPSTKKELRNIL